MPDRGRTFTAEEEQPGGPSVVILSDPLWRRMYGADSTIIGGTISLDGTPATVIGIMPPSFTGTGYAQYWTSLRITPVTSGAIFLPAARSG